MARWITAAPAVLVVVAALVGCGGGGDDGGTSATSKPPSTTTTAPSSTTASTTTRAKPVEGDAVTVKDFSFQPENLQVSVGTTVTWTNRDSATHTASADDGLFDTKSMRPGTSHTFTFERAGTFTYHCNIHPTMTAEIIVR
jgi:plastocyanin